MDTTNKPTICVNCDFHLRDDGIEMWYHHRCVAPGAQSEPSYNYTIGKFSKVELPYCRDINRDGHCPHYKDKDK